MIVPKKIFKEFKTLAFNSIEGYNPTSQNIARWIKFIKFKKECNKVEYSYKKELTKEEKKRIQWVKRRKVSSYLDLPLFFLNKIETVKSQLIVQEATHISLVGSLSRGDFICPLTGTSEDKYYRELSGKLKVGSDIDLIVLPRKQYNITSSSRIDINSGDPNGTKLIIYEKDI